MDLTISCGLTWGAPAAAKLDSFTPSLTGTLVPVVTGLSGILNGIPIHSPPTISGCVDGLTSVPFCLKRAAGSFICRCRSWKSSAVSWVLAVLNPNASLPLSPSLPRFLISALFNILCSDCMKLFNISACFFLSKPLKPDFIMKSVKILSPISLRILTRSSGVPSNFADFAALPKAWFISFLISFVSLPSTVGGGFNFCLFANAASRRSISACEAALTFLLFSLSAKFACRSIMC